MNHIYINGRFLTQKITGVQRVAHEVVGALDHLIENGTIDKQQYSFTLLVPRKGVLFKPSLKNISVDYFGSMTGHLWEQLELPLRVGKQPLLCLCNAAPVFKNRQAVIIHDAAVFGFPQGFSLIFRTWYKIMLTMVGKLAKQIITVSNFSKGELKKYCGIAEGKINVIYEGKEHFISESSDYTILAKNNLQQHSYILAVSSMNPNKNFQAIIKALDYLENLEDQDIKVVIAGGTNPRVFAATTSHFDNRIQYVGYVSDGELRALYENAACFIFPSLYEGFGLPPLEAMSCGCPVVASSAASLPEVCGDAALYCNPDDPKDIAEKITLLLKDKKLREEMKEIGMNRSKSFSWDKCAREIIQSIQQL